MIRRGDLVYDKADPRHVGRVDTITTVSNGRVTEQYVSVTWLKTGDPPMRSRRLPMRDLRLAPEDFQ